MHNISYRILLRCIAESISNRENCPNVVTMRDLFYLYCILENKPCNIAWCLALYLYERGHGKSRGAIAGGSFVCHLAFKLGVANREELDRTQGPGAVVLRIDTGALKHIGILDSRGNLIGGSDDDLEDEASPHEETSGQNPQPSPPHHSPPPQHPSSSSNPFSFEGLISALGSLRSSQDSQFNRINENLQHMDGSIRRMDGRLTTLEDDYRRFSDRQTALESELHWSHYHTERYQPYMESWAHRESTHTDRPLPAYTPPDTYTSPYGGYYYTSSQQPPQTTDRPGPSETLFQGTFPGGGAPSIFQNMDDMDE